MRDIRVKLGTSRRVMCNPGHLEFVATIIAIVGPEMVLGPAFGTVGRQLATRHRYKGTIVTFDDLKIAHHETVIKGDATKPAQTVFGILHKFYSDFGNFQINPPSISPFMLLCQNSAQVCAHE